MILIIDNYDSFTYNVTQLVQTKYQDIMVIKNDEYTVKDILLLNPSGIIISPGPSAPINAGICLELIKKLPSSIPVLGICLGHQIIAEAFGGIVEHAKEIHHGVVDVIDHNQSSLFKNIDSPTFGTRYHSLVVDGHTLPDELIITGKSATDGSIMSIEHRQRPIYGLQFHPESYLSTCGDKFINNFVEIVKEVSCLKNTILN